MHAIRSCFPFREYDGVNPTNPESYFYKQTLILKETWTSEPLGFPWESCLSNAGSLLPLALLSPSPDTLLAIRMILMLLQSESQQAHSPNVILLDWMSFKCVHFD